MAKRRPSGDGMVRLKRKGQWEGRIVVGHKDDSTPIYRYVYGKTQKACLEKLHAMIEQYRDVELTEQSNITLSEWLDKWLNDYMKFTVRESTWSGYKGYIKNHIKPYLGDKQIAFITTADVQKMYNYLKQNGRKEEHPVHGRKLADSTVRSVHMLLHEAMDVAVREHLISKNPTNGTTVPKCNYPPKQILTDEQLKKLMQVIDKDELWRDFFYTELTTGLRRGEICGLRWEDFDESTGRLKVARTVQKQNGGGLTWGDTKTETGTRTIQLPPSTAKRLSIGKQNAVGEWIFPNLYAPELPIHPNTAYKRMKELLKIAELPSIRFHDLRHTFATMALENGMDVKTLSAMIGHVSAATTLDVYSHLTDKMQMQASINIDRKIGGTDAKMPEEKTSEQAAEKPPQPKFEPKKGKIRKSGTSCIYQVSENVWEGSYSPRLPNGKRKKFNIYASTEQECEVKLKELIENVKSEIKAEKEKQG